MPVQRQFFPFQSQKYLVWNDKWLKAGSNLYISLQSTSSLHLTRENYDLTEIGWYVSLVDLMEPEWAIKSSHMLEGELTMKCAWCFVMITHMLTCTCNCLLCMSRSCEEWVSINDQAYQEQTYCPSHTNEFDNTHYGNFTACTNIKHSDMSYLQLHHRYARHFFTNHLNILEKFMLNSFKTCQQYKNSINWLRHHAGTFSFAWSWKTYHWNSNTPMITFQSCQGLCIPEVPGNMTVMRHF